MSSSDSNISLSAGQSKPSQQNVLERVADRSAKKTFSQKKHAWLQFMFRKRVIDDNPEMLSKFTSQSVTNGRILKNTNKPV